MPTKPKDVQFSTDNHTKNSDLTKWMREMYAWGLRVQADIVALETKVGMKQGDPGPPPPPPDSDQ